MKIKNILYVASFMAFAGINAAEQGVANARVERTQATVLDGLALLYPAPADIQKNFFGRAGDHIRAAGMYGYHIVKYPVVAGALCLPMVMSIKKEISSSISNSINWIVYGAVGAATVIGFYKGPSDAREQFKNEKIIKESPINLTRLNAAAAKVAELENIHGLLAQVQANLAVLTAGCDQALSRLNDLKTASDETQRQLTDANAQLDTIVERDQRAKALKLIETLQVALKDMYAMRRVFDAIEADSRTGVDVMGRLGNANNEFAGMQLCQDFIAQISGDTFSRDLSPRHQEMFQGLRTEIQPLLDQQVALRLEMQSIGQQLLFLAPQQEEQRYRHRFGSAATNSPSSVVLQEVPAPRQQQQVQNMQLPMPVLNSLDGFGGRIARPISFFGQQRPVTPPVPTTASEVKMEDLD